MRLLFTLLLVAMVGFAAYWAVAAQVITRYGADILDAAPHVQARPDRVTGFPLAFRTQLEGLTWQDADRSVRWQTPRLGIQTPSYRPNRLQLDFPDQQIVDLAGQRLQIDTARQTIAAVLRYDMTLLSANIDIESLQITPPVLMEGLESLHGTLSQGEAEQYAAMLEVGDIVLHEGFRQQIDPAQTRPARIDSISLDALLTFDAPITLQDESPELQQVAMTSLRLEWGDLALTLSGQVQRSDSRLFDGQLTLHSNTWQGLHELLGASDLLEGDAILLAGMFLAAQADPETGELSLPLSVRQSAISLGPFNLGHLPRL